MNLDIDQHAVGRRLGLRLGGDQRIRAALRQARGQQPGDAERQPAGPAPPRATLQHAAMADQDVLRVEGIGQADPRDLEQPTRRVNKRRTGTPLEPILRGGFHYYSGLRTPDRAYGGLRSHLLFSDEEGSVEQEHLGADCAGDRPI